MNSGNRSNFGPKNWDRKQWGGRGRGGFGGRDRGFRVGGSRNFRGHSFGNNRGYRGGRQNDYGGRGGYQNWNRTPRDTPGKRLTEQEIGVTEYVSNHEGFQGIIKSRYSDFQVAEINLNGEIAKLTDLSVPEPPVDEDVQEDEDLLLNKYNVELLPMDVWDRINKLAVAKATNEKVEVDVEGMTKEQRTKIHDAVKKAFGDSIVGSTVSVDGKKTVRFERFRKGVRIDNRVKWIWGGEHVHFILHKENCDTMDAAQRLADRMRMNLRPSYLGYAGTKDRRAKTSQWFSARKLDPRRLGQAAADLRDIHVGNFTFSDTHLRLGMLKGNRFRIALRNVTATDDTVDAACRLLRDNGFINYYGLQRFGTRADSPTYEIGKSMLKGQLQEAINGILRPRPGPLEPALRQHAALGAGAALAALGAVRPPHSIEMRLLKSLAVQPNDLLGAINKLARNTRLLYIHSYQSVVWNRAASERVRRRGLRPAAGDLVPLTDVADDIDQESDEENTDADGQDGDDAQDGEGGQDGGNVQDDGNIQDGGNVQDGGNILDGGNVRDGGNVQDERNVKDGRNVKDSGNVHDGGNVQDSGNVQDGGYVQDGGNVQDGDTQNGAKTDTQTTTKEPEKKTNLKKVPVKFPVKILTQEDVDSGQYSIFDIILPLPGHFIDYPPNMVDYYEELLMKDGLTLELKNKIKSLSMSGAYRRLVTRPIDMSWSVARYAAPADDLILSDLDEIHGVRLKENADGKYKALLLTMSLPASCYATMALRELLRADTSAQNQALQNNYHKTPEDKGEGDKVEGSEGGEKRKMDSEEGEAKRAKQEE